MGNISDRVKAELHGQTLADQIKAKKATLTDDDATVYEINKMTVQQVAASLGGGGKPVDKGSALLDSMIVGHKAKELTTSTKARKSKVTQAEIDAFCGYPNASGADAIRAVMSLQRKPEPIQGGH